MKSLIILILLFFISFLVYAQNEASLVDLKTPNSPGFQILDIAPSSIERPSNPKEFALNVYNLTNNGTALPKNFAFEISPYWFFKPSNENIYKYLNLKGSRTGLVQGNATGGILRKLSISIASSFNDSATGSLLSNTNYVAFGARTNLITINGKKRIDRLQTSFKIMHAQIAKAGFKPGGGINSPDEIEEALKNDSVYQDALKQLPLGEAAIQPLFQLDAAYAYSEAFADNNYKYNRFNKSGLWLNATLSAGSLLRSKTDQLFILFLGRAIWDNALIDTARNVFENENAYDIGGKLDWTIGNLSLSFEHLNRIYSNNKDLNSKRTVGIIQYKINNNLYITGSFGETFGNTDNLVTLFGINWGLGKSALPVKDSPQ